LKVEDLGGQLLDGRVTRVGEAADTRTGAVTVEIELAARPDLRSGQIASAATVCPRRAQRPAASPASPPRRCWRLTAPAPSCCGWTAASPAARP
jgi:hypothetical protein